MRLPLCVLALGASLLCVAQAPAYPLWLVALGVTEGGHWLAPACLLAFLPGWRADRAGLCAAACAAAAFLLLLTPLLRARRAAASLPGELERAFGPVRGKPGRPAPLSLRDLWLGVPVAPVSTATEPFGPAGGPDLRMDVFFAAPGPAPHPLVLSVHGGSWRSGERSEFAAMNRYLAGRGYVVASTDYRLAPGAVFPAQVGDVRAAIARLKSRAAAYGGDPSRLVLIGRSAGGQIALCAAYDRPDPSLRGIVAFYAPNDMVYAYENPSPPLIMDSVGVIGDYMGGPPAARPALYEAASPLRMVGPATAPTLLIHGLRDELVWPGHSERLSAALARAGRPSCWVRLPWATHGCDYNLSGPGGQLSLYAVERFLDATTR